MSFPQKIKSFIDKRKKENPEESFDDLIFRLGLAFHDFDEHEGSIRAYLVKPIKKMQSKLSPKLIKVKANSIEIRINLDSDDKGFEILKSPLIYDFIKREEEKGNNLVQTLPNKPFNAKGPTTLYLRAINFPTWKKNLKWKDIKCESISPGWLKTTPCTVGSPVARVFVKVKGTKKNAGFGAYLKKLYKGKISRQQHQNFIETLQVTMGNKLIEIHNEDISWFHLKAFSEVVKKKKVPSKEKVAELVEEELKKLSHVERGAITAKQLKVIINDKVDLSNFNKVVFRDIVREVAIDLGVDDINAINEKLLPLLKKRYKKGKLKTGESYQEFERKNLDKLVGSRTKSKTRFMKTLEKKVGFDIDDYRDYIKNKIKSILEDRSYFSPRKHKQDCLERSPKPLLPEQLKVIEFMQENPALLVAQGVGCGKTLEGVVASQCYLDENPQHQVIFIVPASVISMWQEELMSMTKYPDPRIKIFSYEKFAQLPEDYIDCNNSMLVLDEAHRIRNFKTKNSKAVVKCAQKADKRLLLTATPFINTLYDFVPIINILWGENIAYAGRRPEQIPGVQQPHIKIDKKFTRETKGKLQIALANKVDFIEDCSERYPGAFPHKEDYYIPVSMDNSYKKIYLKAITSQKENDDFKKSQETPWKQPEVFYHGYRQAVGKTLDKYYSLKMSKAIGIILDKMTSKKKKVQKTIIFTNWKEHGTKILKSIIDDTNVKLKKEGKKKPITFGIFSGEKNKQQRRELIKDYNSGKTQILIITRAGAEGLDLKGTRNIIILDPVWNPAMMTQIIGRGIRRGSHTHLPPRKRKVAVYRLILTYPGITNPDLTASGRVFNEELPLHTQLTGDQILYRIISKKEGMQAEINNLLDSVKIN